MGDVVNLNQFRKKQERKKAEKTARNNRARFGRSKAEKNAEHHRENKNRTDLEHKKLTSPGKSDDDDDARSDR
jgi:hypothetical protein